MISSDASLLDKDHGKTKKTNVHQQILRSSKEGKNKKSNIKNLESRLAPHDINPVECDMKGAAGYKALPIDPTTGGKCLKPNPTFKPFYNGCGPQTYFFKDLFLGELAGEMVRATGRSILPDNFQCCCNGHDVCYATLGSDKNKCDADFAQCLSLACVGSTNESCFSMYQHAARMVAESPAGCDAYASDQNRASDCTACTCDPSMAASSSSGGEESGPNYSVISNTNVGVVVPPPGQVPPVVNPPVVGCPVSMCSSWLCELQKMTSPPVTCTYDADCLPWGHICVPSSLDPVKLSCEGFVKNVGEACTKDSQCLTGACYHNQVCQCRECKTPGCGGCTNGLACYNTSDLSPNTCLVAGKKSLELNSPCQYSDQCVTNCCSHKVGSPNICEVSSKLNYCTADSSGLP